MTQAAGVRAIRLHDARHSCGTAMHLRGVPLAVIAKWLGLADASVAARFYAHSQDDALRSAGQTLGAVAHSVILTVGPGPNHMDVDWRKRMSNEVFGSAPEGIRTPNLLIRRRVQSVPKCP